MTRIDLTAIARAVGEALPNAEPFAAIPLLTAQIDWLNINDACDLIDRIIARAHPDTWRFTDKRLDKWPHAVATRALEAVRGLPPSESRFEALCRVALRLSRQEQEEVLSAILDNSFTETTYAHSKPMSRRGLIVRFLRTLSAEAQEAWVSRQQNNSSQQSFSILTEVLDRQAVGRLTEKALRDIWNRISETTHDDIPLDYLRVAHHMPLDLREIALSRIRACPSRDDRLLHLKYFDEELTDEERHEIVQVPWNSYTRDDPCTQVDHLRQMATHLPKVSLTLRRYWLKIVLNYPEDFYDRQPGLLALLPFLVKEDRDAAVAGIVASVQEVGYFYDDARWDLLPDDTLHSLLLRLRSDLYGWRRDGLIHHILTQRTPAFADEAFMPLLEKLDIQQPETRLEIIHALTPWLADRTAGKLPRVLAALPVPACDDAAPDALYKIARVLKNC